MDDLVERLLLIAAWRKPGGPTPKEKMPDTYGVATEAASRIAALEAQLKTVLDREAETIARYDAKLDAYAAQVERLTADKAGLVGQRSALAIGDRVEKIKGSCWTGHVVGFYRTELTPYGVCVESEREPGSVQIYPEAALKIMWCDEEARAALEQHGCGK